MSYYSSKTFYSTIWSLLQPYKKVAGLGILLSIMAGWWGPLNSMIIKQVVNLLVNREELSFFTLISWGMLIVVNFIVFDNITWRMIGYLNYRYQGLLKNDTILYFTQKILTHSHHYFQDNESGRLTHHVIMLAQNLERIICRMAPDFIRACSLVVVSLITSYYVSPLFCCILFSWFFLFCSFSIFMASRLTVLSSEHAAQESTITGTVVDTIAHQGAVRACDARQFEAERLSSFLDKLQSAFQKKEYAYLLLAGVQGALIALMMGCTIAGLLYYYRQSVLTVGDFTLMIGLSMELGHTIWHAMDRVEECNQAYGACIESLQLLTLESGRVDDPSAHELSFCDGKIEFDKVTFGYPGHKTFFENLSITIPAGQRVGLVGYSGAGKSTFVHLVQRLYDYSAGAILIDGYSLGAITQASLHKAIGIIPQEPQLFHRTIAENILYARRDASHEELIAASKKAHAHEFIMQLEGGYDALVGERGVKLSGGQRQRLALARAFLKNAPILILDEATSQLDSLTESLIQESLWTLMRGKTTLIIAHRLSTLMTVDRILVFDKGVIVQDGTHQELIAVDGLYKKLWETQVAGFIVGA